MEPQNYKLISNKTRNRHKKMPLDFNLNQKHGLIFKYQSICECLLLQFKRICRVNRFIVSLRKIR